MKPLLLILTLTLPPLATQADTAAPETLPTVTSTLNRDASALPYAGINTVLTKLAQHGEGLVRMDFSVDRQKTRTPVSDTRLAVAGDEVYLPIKLDAEGRFALPLLPEAQAKTADLATNLPKGALHVRGVLALNLTPAELDMARVRQVMRVAHRLKTELLPFYLRWLFPRIEGVMVCASEPRFELEWREGGQLLGLPLPPGEVDPEAGKGQPGRACALMTGAEAWPDSARLLAPADARLAVKLAR